MTATFEIGDAIPLTWEITVGGVATNGTVVLTVTLPDGTTSTPAVSNPSAGSYASSITATANGTHTYRWVSTGAVVAADSGTFVVGRTYCSLAALKASLGIDDTNDDAALQKALEAASNAIDLYTGTTFAVAVATARTFTAENAYRVWVDRFTDTASLVVKTGTDGTYPTTISSSDVTPWPFNAPARGLAYERLGIATGALPFSPVRPTVQVTAKWGYGTCPADVEEACRIKAAQIYRRKDSPEGIAGTSEFGVVRISKFEDPDVVKLLAPYCNTGVA